MIMNYQSLTFLLEENESCMLFQQVHLELYIVNYASALAQHSPLATNYNMDGPLKDVTGCEHCSSVV